MRHVSREDGGPRKPSVAMEQPDATNSTRTKNTPTPTAEMTAVPLLQALLYRQRDELATDRAALKVLQRARAAEIKRVREEEAVKCRNLLSDLKYRLERDHEDALHRQKDAITKSLNSEMLCALNEKDAEMRRQIAEARLREDLLKLQVGEDVHAGRDVTGCQYRGACSGRIQKLQQEATALRLENRQLQERLQLEEIKSKDRAVSQLEERLNLQKEDVSERGQQWAETEGQRRQYEHCECAELNCGEVPPDRLQEFQRSGMKEGVEAELQVADSGEQVEQLQVEQLQVEQLQVEQLQVEQLQVEQLQTLRAELEKRDRIIAELQRGEKLPNKHHKPDHLSNRHRKEQMRQFYRHFMELEPVAELEEDSGAGEDSPTSSSSPSLSPQPYTADMWAELPDRQYHDTLYSCLLKEHLELQREYQFLQNRLQRVLTEPDRTRLKLERELTAALSNIRKLKRLLAEQEDGAAVLTDRIAQLQVETHDLREQNELLEFRILELEECHDNASVRSHWPDTRDVWTDTESDDVSDSGVQSLPSSESDGGNRIMKMDFLNEDMKGRLHDFIDATPNTEERSCLKQVMAMVDSWQCRPQDSATAGRGQRSSSESNRIVATVLPFTDKGIDGGDNIKKHLKNSECLQESGIFEETEYNSQGTQTDEINLDALIWDLRVPFEAGFVGDLSVEIQRLNQFRERVEEAGHCCGSKKLLCGDEDLPSQRKELEYCRQRMQVLEDKVRIYESSGDQQARLLTDRLQREVSLSAQVQQLSAKVQQLIAVNSCLEEQKCEMEEAENDTRLRWQKLEVKLITLNESKTDLESQLQQERRTLGRLRSALSKSERQEEDSRRHLNYLEVMLNKYEQRNFDLEEREMDLRHRLEMLESSIPALVIWNIWRIFQSIRILQADANSASMSRRLLEVANIGNRCGGEDISNTALGASVTLCPRPYTLEAPRIQDATSASMSSRLLEVANTGNRCGGEDISNTAIGASVTLCPPRPYTVEAPRIQDNEEQGLRIETDLIGSEEVRRPIDEQLRFHLIDLEAEVVLLKAEIQICKESEDKHRQRISELEEELDDIKSDSQVDGIKSPAEADLTQNEMTDVRSRICTNLECVIKAQELADSEANLKKRIVELEVKDRAYMETLQRADELWSDMETSQKRRIADAEEKETEMKEMIRKLQESELKLRQALRQDDEKEMLLEKIQNLEENEKILAERVRYLETEKSQMAEEIKQLGETLHSEQKELENTKEMVAGPLKEELLKERKVSRSLQEEIKTAEKDFQNRSKDQEAQMNVLRVQLRKMSRDLVDLECTNGELKEEVETLETKVGELKAAIEEQKQREEKLAIKMSQKIQQKEQELEELKREMRFSLTPTAHDELSEVDRGVMGTDRTATDRGAVGTGGTATDRGAVGTGGTATDRGALGTGGTATDATSKPAVSEIPDVQTTQARKDPCRTRVPNLPVPELTSQAQKQIPGTAQEGKQKPPEVPPRRRCGCKWSVGGEQPLPVSTLAQKPVLRRWLHSQSLQRQTCSHWRHC